MARTPKEINPAAAAAWQGGDEAEAARLSGLQPRQLRNRLGPPGRRPAPVVAPSAPTPQKLAQVKPVRRAPSPVPMPPPSDPEPTTVEIESIDTLEEAEALFRDVRRKMPEADDVRYASLAEKALAALNRIEQIKARRPHEPARDEVQEAIRGEMDTCVSFLLLPVREAAAKLKADRAAFGAWARETLAPSHAAEVVGRVDAMLGGQTA